MRADANEAVIINEIINADFFAFSLVLFGAFLGKPKKHHAWWKTILSIAIEHFFLNGALHIFHPHELCLFTQKIRALVFFMQIILDAYYNFPFKAMIFPGQKLYSLENWRQLNKGSIWIYILIQMFQSMLSGSWINTPPWIETHLKLRTFFVMTRNRDDWQ